MTGMNMLHSLSLPSTMPFMNPSKIPLSEWSMDSTHTHLHLLLFQHMSLWHSNGYNNTLSAFKLPGSVYKLPRTDKNIMLTVTGIQLTMWQDSGSFYPPGTSN